MDVMSHELIRILYSSIFLFICKWHKNSLKILTNGISEILHKLFMEINIHL